MLSVFQSSPAAKQSLHNSAVCCFDFSKSPLVHAFFHPVFIESTSKGLQRRHQLVTHCPPQTSENVPSRRCCALCPFHKGAKRLVAPTVPKPAPKPAPKCGAAASSSIPVADGDMCSCSRLCGTQEEVLHCPCSEEGAGRKLMNGCSTLRILLICMCAWHHQHLCSVYPRLGNLQQLTGPEICIVCAGKWLAGPEWCTPPPPPRGGEEPSLGDRSPQGGGEPSSLGEGGGAGQGGGGGVHRSSAWARPSFRIARKGERIL